MASASENRRKRIMERGSDRLAFITGQTDSLPPPSSVTPQEFSQTPSLHKTNVATTHEKDDVTDTVLPKCEPSNEAASNFLDTYRKVQPSISLLDQTSTNRMVSSSIRTSSNPVVGTEPHLVPQPNNRKTIFTANRINSSISASENIRLLCSAVIALLVILSFCMYPLGRSTITGMIVYRPLYLVLVTDVTVVLGLLLTNQEGSDKAESEARRAGLNTNDWADSVAKALEVGLVLQKATSAVFMDCSVYAVLLISGLSLLRLG